jgi:hypothetical protein
METIFNNIYKNNAWNSKESVSGSGSTLNQTKKIRKVLPKLIQDFKINSILDIPCGDFNWMKEISLNIKYIGADIVDTLTQNNKKYENNLTHFLTLDATLDRLPKTDLIICRDCLVHFSFKDFF